MAKERVLEYSVFIYPGEDNGYIAKVPAIPGCITHGETIEEAMAMAKDAAEGCLAVLQKEGEPIPTERGATIRKVRFNRPVAA